MAIDFKQLAQKYQDEMMQDLISLLKIESVRDESKGTKEAPLGPGPKKALDHFLALAQRDGFTTKEFDGLAGHIEFGEGNEDLGILAHVDVMPAGKGWTTNPFEPVIKDGNIYARGASDDKGPSMAAYYGLKMVKDLNVPTSKKVRFILGTDEESAWRGMTHYFEKMPKPTFGFSPDAFFPIINGEKGNVTYFIDLPTTNEGQDKLINFDSGLRDNMVPRDAVAEIVVADKASVVANFEHFVANNPIEGKTSQTAAGVKLEVIGKAAHAQEPRNGINAGLYLAKFLDEELELAGGAANFVKLLAQYVFDASRMEKFDAAYTTEKMGDLTMNAGIMHFDEKTAKITLNFRYPQGIDADYIKAALAKVVVPMNATITKAAHAMEPHYVSADDPLVKTLLDVYAQQTNLPAKEMVVGGGTYGRLMKRGVAFGAMFPGVPDTMHQANEFVPVADLVAASAIYAQAIYELIK